MRRSLLGLLAIGALAPLRTFCAPPAATPPAGAAVGLAADERAPSGQGHGVFRPGIYRGQLGEHEIQVELDLETQAEDSVSGWYFVFGDGSKILLAGEFEGPHLSLEESHDGKDVSGTWSGEMSDASIAGQWHDADETIAVPFHLNLIAPPRASQS